MTASISFPQFGISTERKPINSKDQEALNSSKEIDLTTLLSTNEIDFSIQDRTWRDTAKLTASIILKAAIFSYLFYFLAGPAIQFLAPNLLQGRVMQFLLTSRIGEIVSGCVCNVSSNPVLAEMSKHIGNLALKILVSAWALHATLRYITQRLIMLPLYLAQSRIIKLLIPDLRTSSLNNYRIFLAKNLEQQNFIIRDVVLKKNGTRYSGLLIGSKETISNGQWVLQATGNGEPIEHTADDFALTYNQAKYNVLLINGPSVGKSEGQATPESMGDAQEIGLRFIEEKLKAKKIVIAGRSLGAAAVGLAILKHEFKKDISYLVVSQMTFDRASNICAKKAALIFPRLGRFVSKIVKWAGCEMDVVASSKKLQMLGIKEVIVQATHKKIEENKLPTISDFASDTVICVQAALGYALINEKITDNKIFRCLEKAEHMTLDAAKAVLPEISAL